MCCVLCAVCCVLCAVCCVLCAVCCVLCVVSGGIEPGPKTKALRILIIFGGGRCWFKEYQKNLRKIPENAKICILLEDTRYNVAI